MESPYDFDISGDTRDLIARGLATDTRKYSSRIELETVEQDLAPARSMNTSYVRLPPVHVVQTEEPSARGLSVIRGENVKGQNYNTSFN